MGSARADEPSLVASASLTFEQSVPVILDRWTAERNTRVTDAELAQARDYLRRCGIRVHPVDGGRFLVDGSTRAVEGTDIILIGVRHLVAVRVQAFK